MKLNLLLLVLLVASVAANFGLSDNPGRRNFEAMPEMVRTIAYKAFAPNASFADGKTLQPPPEGTIPRRTFLATANEDGARVYQTYCQPCHGGAGKGDGPVATRGFPPPPSLLAASARNLTDDQILEIITQGRKNMPSYAAQVPADNRRRVVAYVRSLQGSAKP